MNVDANFLNSKLDEYCLQKGILLDDENRNTILDYVNVYFNASRVIDSTVFLDIIEYNNDVGQYNIIDFNDEIVSIEEYGETESVDFNVSGNKLFYANSILTHNSAVNNLEADNSSVSDSVGTISTADFIVFLLQTDTMKEANLITCKCTKNRFTGRTDKWDMCIDYTHMRFSDAVVQNSGLDEREIKKIITENDINDLKIIQKHDSMMSEDFSEKQRHETQETQVNATFDVASFLGI